MPWPEDYENLNILQTSSGDIFFMTGHDEWLDTWHVGVLNDKNTQPEFTKVGIMDHDWALSPKDLFEEGLAIAQYSSDPKRIGFLATPYDYRESRCNPLTFHVQCTHFWAWDRQF